MKFWIVPIEPFEERYSSQWAKWFNCELESMNRQFAFIDGKILTDKITTGSFLDVCGTNYYKASQLMQIADLLYRGKIKNGDVFLFHDIWFPGIEMLAYMRQGLKVDFKITGCLHAGTWDTWDFINQAGMQPWASKIESGWFEFIDLVFVATNFHKDLIVTTYPQYKNKIKKTGFPLYWNNKKAIKKEKIIVFPHRLDIEKQPHCFDKLISQFPNWKFIKTKEHWNGSKDLYYDILLRSQIAVSFARQETWGIAMQEALFCNCIPVVPNCLSYSEMYHSEFIYDNTFLGAVELIKKIETNLGKYENLVKQNQQTLKKVNKQAIQIMIREILWQ